MSIEALRSAWNQDGYFFIRGMIEPQRARTLARVNRWLPVHRA